MIPITSLAFAGFAVLVFVVYHFLSPRGKQIWLLLASLAFYGLWDWHFGLILLALTGLNYWLGKRLGQSGSKGLMWAGIGINLVALILFKYQGFYIEGLSNLLGTDLSTGAMGLLLPIGLSFYLVQVISYFVDVSLKRIEAEDDWLLFMLYLFYFPKLLSGPIERARTFIPKLREPATVDARVVQRSAALIVIGLVRKLVVADSLLALIPEEAFSDPGIFSAQHLAAWLLGYAFALYNDFAGYTSIVRGISGLLGIELSQNFLRPYFAKDFTEFWKRWHISLSEWLRDYIFFPVTRKLMGRIKNRQHLLNLIIPPMVTMLISGLWHGLSWQMLVWGGLHGLYQVVERLFSQVKPGRPPAERKWWQAGLSMVVVFVLAVLAWLPFRMALPQAWDYLIGMVSPGNWADPAIRQAGSDLIRGKGFWAWPEYNLPDPRIFLVILPALWLDWRQEVKQNELFFMKWRTWGQVLLLVAAILALLLVSGADAQVPFVYQGF